MLVSYKPVSNLRHLLCGLQSLGSAVWPHPELFQKCRIPCPTQTYQYVLIRSQVIPIHMQRTALGLRFPELMCQNCLEPSLPGVCFSRCGWGERTCISNPFRWAAVWACSHLFPVWAENGLHIFNALEKNLMSNISQHVKITPDWRFSVHEF